MASTRKRHNRSRKSAGRHRTPPGSPPGVINIPDDALRLKINWVAFSLESVLEEELTSAEQIEEKLKTYPNKVHWFEVKGFGNKALLEEIADCFKIHRLQLEDVVNVYQRPKMEECAGYLFFVCRLVGYANHHLTSEQISLFLGSNYVVTFQDKYDDVLNPVKERIRRGKGFMRTSGADYLAYSLIDIVVDNYFPVLEHLGERLDDLQDELIYSPKKETLNIVLEVKRELVLLRRNLWSERDKMNDILRSPLIEIKDGTKVFFRDTYDHCIQALDLVENYKEVTASLMDIYQSSVSNKLNQVMKVLTIISTIFIPLTFIVGLYGMNFSRKDPETGEFFPYNMPELYSPHGYLVVCMVMLLIVILQLIFFYRKGWLTKG